MHHLLSFFPRPPQRDYVTRRRAILVYLLSIVSLNKNPPYPGFESVSVRLVSSNDYRDVVDTREVFHLNGIKISEESLDSNLSRIMQVCFTSSIRTKQDITIFKHHLFNFSLVSSRVRLRVNLSKRGKVTGAERYINKDLPSRCN